MSSSRRSPRPALTQEEQRSLRSTLLRADTEDALLADVAHQALGVTGAESCDLFVRVQANTLLLRASTIAPEYAGRMRLGRGVGITGHVLQTAQPMVVPGRFERHPRFANYPGIDERGFQSAVCFPLPNDGGEPLGVALLRRRGPWRPGKAQLARIAAFCEEASFLLRAHRAVHTAASRLNRIGAVSEVASILASSPYLEEILQLLVNITARTFAYRVCTVRLLDERTNELVLRATQATMKAYQRKRAIRLGESIAGKAISERRPIAVMDVQVEEDYIGHDLAVEQGLRSMICVPLTIQDRAVGVLTCYTGEVREFAEDEVKSLETIAAQAAVSIEHAKLQVRHTLMQEMHHRVKNNLQQVASLLRLQLRHGHYRSIEEATNDSLNRILAIATVHDLLSREDLDHVGVRSIAETLVAHHAQSFLPPDRQIEFSVRGEDVRLNMTQATQVALVLNELIQNSIEHGFRVATQGEVHVNVETADGQVGIWVSNNGDQLPPGFDAQVASHLGLQIVANLSRALGGAFKLGERLGWTVAEVKFVRATSE
jgi:two-component sensor histidine kinase